MSRRSVSMSLEAKVLEKVRELCPDIRAVGLLEVADEGTQKEEDLTSFQVRVYNFQQPNEGAEMYAVAVEVRLNVEQAESANGGVFLSAHEKFALWLERVMIGDRCTELETAEAHVDGLQRTGDDKDFDAADGVWFAIWNMTLTGRVKKQQEESDNG